MLEMCCPWGISAVMVNDKYISHITQLIPDDVSESISYCDYLNYNYDSF